ncbi:hypothetical protein [Glutamicibacter halophytocola]|uniref:hypothetical protein n=1 Tax=Glutamicibacter halophytocola TaxID=1933880 RepID=UPI00189294B9|nr:hypothetical protein [Glutamicibacter halophytocola]
MMDELFITMARLDATAPRNREGGEGMTTEPAMPVRVGALEVRSALRLWVEIKTNGEIVALDASKLAKDKFAGKFLPMLQGLLAKAERAIDNPMEKHVYGNCLTMLTDGATGEEYECGEQLQAAPDADSTECPNCGAWYDLDQLRAERTAYFRKTPLPPREAREELETQSGVKLNKKTFENWVDRRHVRYVLERIGFGEKERRLYFPIDLLAAHQKIRE